MWEIINFAISTESVISPLTKINIKNSLIEDSLQKLLIALINFFVEIGHSIANNVNKPLDTDCTTYLKTLFYIL